jgi:DNA-binding GntR family transcriptional regulator
VLRDVASFAQIHHGELIPRLLAASDLGATLHFYRDRDGRSGSADARKRRTSTPERRRCYHAEHTAIVDALRDRDPDGAQAAMRRHLHNVADNLLVRHRQRSIRHRRSGPLLRIPMRTMRNWLF